MRCALVGSTTAASAKVMVMMMMLVMMMMMMMLMMIMMMVIVMMMMMMMTMMTYCTATEELCSASLFWKWLPNTQGTGDCTVLRMVGPVKISQ